MLLHELDGLQVLNQPFMREEWSSVPRDIHLYDEHAGNELFDRDTFCRHTFLGSKAEEALFGLADGREVSRMLSVKLVPGLIVVRES